MAGKPLQNKNGADPIVPHGIRAGIDVKVLT
jgi:hypothetical protein